LSGFEAFQDKTPRWGMLFSLGSEAVRLWLNKEKPVLHLDSPQKIAIHNEKKKRFLIVPDPFDGGKFPRW
jgi:hypothetical protein